MPLKSSKTQKAKKSSKIVPDGLKFEEMGRKQLLLLIKKMIVEVTVEKQERQFFMLEAEKLFNLWNIVLEKVNLVGKMNLLLEQNLERCGNNSLESENRLRDDQLRAFKTNETDRLEQLRLKYCQNLSILRQDLWIPYQMVNETYFRQKQLYFLTPYAHYQEKRHISKRNLASNVEIIQDASSKTQDIIDAFYIEFEYRYKHLSGKKWDHFNMIDYVREYFKKYDESMEEVIYEGNDDILELFHFFRTRFDDNVLCYDELRLGINFQIGLKQILCRRVKKYTDIYEKRAGINEYVTDEIEECEYLEILKEYYSVRRNIREKLSILDDLYRQEIFMECASECLTQRIKICQLEINQYRNAILEGLIEFERVKRVMKIEKNLEVQKSSSVTSSSISSSTSSSTSTSISTSTSSSTSSSIKSKTYQKRKEQSCYPISSSMGRTKMCKSKLTPSLELLEKEREKLMRKLSYKFLN